MDHRNANDEELRKGMDDFVANVSTVRYMGGHDRQE